MIREKPMHPIVLCHGYGCGGAVFLPSIQNIFCTLSQHTTDANNISPIHIIDWLGNGLSSRPPFNCVTTGQAEDFYVESLEAWRRSMHLDKMILCAHSLGAYCSVLYAIKYPQHISQLVLISPVGLPQKPVEWEQRLLSNTNSSTRMRFGYRLVGWLWEKNLFTDLLRYVGPKGKDFLHWIVDKRLYRLDDEEKKALLSEYLYHILAMNGGASGEKALSKILQPGAWAHDPLCHRIGALKKLQKEYGFDIDFVYGSNDWMNCDHAFKVKEEGLIDCDVHIVDDCGHQLLLEKSDEFGQMIGSLIVKGQSDFK